MKARKDEMSDRRIHDTLNLLDDTSPRRHARASCPAVLHEPGLTSFFNRRVLFILAVVLLMLWSRPHAGSLRFPLTNEACPTSSFGSWRAGHLHAGLDFSTGGVTGVPVLAVDSCWVWRIRLWNGGYGKALYAELADGKVAVYGHLSRFIAEIDSMVETEQDLKGVYDVELLFGPWALSFSAGDTLAFSGDTGSGPPHLHFELRSGREDHDKINPVPDYMNLAEAFEPVIKSIRVIPLEAESSVNGGYAPLQVLPAWETRELTVAGAFGLSVEAVDRVQCGRIVTPIYYDASIDQVPVWVLSLDRFPFSRAHYVGGIYEILDGSKFVRLYDPFSLDLAGFTCRKPAGPPDTGLLTPGKHDLAIRVTDAWGNADEVTLPFMYGSPPAFRQFRLLRDGGTVRVVVEPEPRGSAVEIAYRTGGVWRPVDTSSREGGLKDLAADPDSRVEVRCRLRGEGGLLREGVLAIGGHGVERDTFEVRTEIRRDFIEVYGQATGPPSSLPTALVRAGDLADSIVFQPAGENLFRATYIPDGRDRSLLVAARCDFGDRVVRSNARQVVACLEPGAEVWFSGERYRVRLKAPMTYSSRSFVSVSESPGRDHRGFESAAGGLAFEPLDVFFNDRIDVLVIRREGDLAGHYGVFAESGEWASFRGRFDEAGRCEFGIRQSENLLILQDEEGPRIDPVTDLRRRPHDGKATFASRITDLGSGVDAGSVRAYVDGRVAIVSIDPDTGRVSGRTTKPLPYGQHRIRLVAEDRLGNSAGREFAVDLSR